MSASLVSDSVREVSTYPGQRQFKTTEEVRVKEKERHEAQKDWDDVEGSKPIVNLQAKVKPILDQYLAEGQTLSGAHPAQIKNRLNEEAKTFITTKGRNTRHVVIIIISTLHIS